MKYQFDNVKSIAVDLKASGIESFVKVTTGEQIAVTKGPVPLDGGEDVHEAGNGMAVVFVATSLAEALGEVLADILADVLTGHGPSNDPLDYALTDLLVDLLAGDSSSAGDLVTVLADALADHLANGGSSADLLASALVGDDSFIFSLAGGGSLIGDIAAALAGRDTSAESLADKIAGAIKSGLAVYAESFESSLAVPLCASPAGDSPASFAIAEALAGGATISSMYRDSLESGGPIAETIAAAVLSALKAFTEYCGANLVVALSSLDT